WGSWLVFGLGRRLWCRSSRRGWCCSFRVRRLRARRFRVVWLWLVGFRFWVSHVVRGFRLWGGVGGRRLAARAVGRRLFGGCRLKVFSFKCERRERQTLSSLIS